MTRKEFEERVFGDANEKFVGTVQDEDNKSRYDSLVETANVICTKRNGFIGVKTEDPEDNTHRHCSIYVDLKQCGSTNKRNIIDGISLLLRMSDDVAYSILGGNLRITFSIYDVWSNDEPFDRESLTIEDDDEISDEEIKSLNNE